MQIDAQVRAVPTIEAEPLAPRRHRAASALLLMFCIGAIAGCGTDVTTDPLGAGGRSADAPRSLPTVGKDDRAGSAAPPPKDDRDPLEGCLLYTSPSPRDS